MGLSKLEPFAWIFLGGLIVWGYQAASHSPTLAAASADKRPTMDERKRDVRSMVSAGPQTKLWVTPHGEIIEVAIPTASIGGRFVQFKRCTVWRDPITATSSISCPSEPAEDRDLYPTDGPDNSDLR